MPTAIENLKRVPITCPACGHRQLEPATVFSTNCLACGRHVRVQEPIVVAPTPTPPDHKRKSVTCFDCGVAQEVAITAVSTLCRRCGRYIDLGDYKITTAVSRNFRTRGALVLETKGYLFNSEACVGDAILKGRFIGKLTVERTLTIHSSADIKGHFQAHRLLIPSGNVFAWKTPLSAHTVEIAGELAGTITGSELVVVRAGGRFFGQLRAKAMVVEEGAVLVGDIRVKRENDARVMDAVSTPNSSNSDHPD